MFEDTTLDFIYLDLPFVWLDLFGRLPLQFTRIETCRQTVAAVPLAWFTRGLQIDGLKAIGNLSQCLFNVPSSYQSDYLL